MQAVDAAAVYENYEFQATEHLLVQWRPLVDSHRKYYEAGIANVFAEPAAVVMTIIVP